jgi:hypothetical protein
MCAVLGTPAAWRADDSDNLECRYRGNATSLYGGSGNRRLHRPYFISEGDIDVSMVVVSVEKYQLDWLKCVFSGSNSTVGMTSVMYGKVRKMNLWWWGSFCPSACFISESTERIPINFVYTKRWGEFNFRFYRSYFTWNSNLIVFFKTVYRSRDWCVAQNTYLIKTCNFCLKQISIRCMFNEVVQRKIWLCGVVYVVWSALQQ